MTSGLELQLLKGVWDVAARTSNHFLVKDEFYVALRLVAYLQNSMAATEQAIQLNVEAPLPRFNDYVPATPGAPTHNKSSPRGAAAQRMGGGMGMQGGINPDALPDLDSLDFSNPAP